MAGGDKAAEQHEKDQPSELVAEPVRRKATPEERQQFRDLQSATFVARFGNDPVKREAAEKLLSEAAERIYGPLKPGLVLTDAQAEELLECVRGLFPRKKP